MLDYKQICANTGIKSVTASDVHTKCLLTCEEAPHKMSMHLGYMIQAVWAMSKRTSSTQNKAYLYEHLIMTNHP